MATDENNHKNEARDDWTGCTFRVERGPSSEGRAWGMADILPALCANVLDEFVRAPLPRSTSRRAGRPAGSTPLRVRTVFFRAVMFPLHCYPHIVLFTPRVVSSSPLSS